MDEVNYAAELAYQRAVLNDREQKVHAYAAATVQAIHENLADEALRCDANVAQAANEQQRLAYKEEMAKATQMAIDLERNVVITEAKRLAEIGHDRDKLELLANQHQSAQVQLQATQAAQQAQLLANLESDRQSLLRQEATTQQQMSDLEARQAEGRAQLEARQAEERRQLEVRQREEHERGPNR